MPGFLELAAHPLRWAILHELARSDLQVSELSRRLGESQNLVSYHLARLRQGEMVVTRRSDHDHRQAYYHARLDRCADLLAASARALHPALAMEPIRATLAPPATPTRVLFLCTGNSARSQMAEGLLNHLSRGIAQAASAGDEPRGVHPNAVRAMAEMEIDISAHRSKHLDAFAHQRFDHVITLCDHVRERCPEFPDTPVVHWSIPDPVDLSRRARDRETYPAFQSAAAELATRVRYFLALAATAAA